jgi:hypothetical protein
MARSRISSCIVPWRSDLDPRETLASTSSTWISSGALARSPALGREDRVRIVEYRHDDT